MYVCVYICTTYNLFATIKYEQVMKKKMKRNPSRSRERERGRAKRESEKEKERDRENAVYESDCNFHMKLYLT